MSDASLEKLLRDKLKAIEDRKKRLFSKHQKRAKRSAPSVQVVAVSRGYYGNKIREIGEKFLVPAELQNASWLQVIPKGVNLSKEEVELLAEGARLEKAEKERGDSLNRTGGANKPNAPVALAPAPASGSQASDLL